MRRHMLKVSAGLFNSSYYLGNFTIDLLIFIALESFSFAMVLIGYRKEGFDDKISQTSIALIDLFTKLSFACILLPSIYLFGYLLR
jgi:hypothetical protein